MQQIEYIQKGFQQVSFWNLEEVQKQIQMLTLKQKLQLFKLSKKPRRQIRLKLQLISDELNLPSLNIDTTNLQSSSKTIARSNNFRRADSIQHPANSMSGTLMMPRVQESQSKWMKQSDWKLKQSLHERKSANRKVNKLYHANSRTQELLRQFGFNMKREEKMGKIKTDQSVRELRVTMQGRREETKSGYLTGSSSEWRSSSNTGNSIIINNTSRNSFLLSRLKNQLNTLIHSNNLYKKQLHYANFITNIQQNVNSLGEQAASTMVMRFRW